MRGHRFATAASLAQWRNPECVIAGEESLALPLCVALTLGVATDGVRGGDALLALAFAASIVATTAQRRPFTMANGPLCKNEAVQSRLGPTRSAGRKNMLLIDLEAHQKPVAIISRPTDLLETGKLEQSNCLYPKAPLPYLS